MSELTSHEIKIIESITGKVMDTLGYERVLVKEGDELDFSKDEIEFFHQENLKAKNKKATQADPSDLKRRKLQIGFMEQISQAIPA